MGEKSGFVRSGQSTLDKSFFLYRYHFFRGRGEVGELCDSFHVKRVYPVALKSMEILKNNISKSFDK